MPPEAADRMMQSSLRRKDWDAVNELARVYQDPFDRQYRCQGRPITKASKNGRLDVVQNLLGYGANPNGLPKEKTPPLKAAERKKKRDVAKALMHAGAVAYEYKKQKKREKKIIKEQYSYKRVPIFYVPTQRPATKKQVLYN